MRNVPKKTRPKAYKLRFKPTPISRLRHYLTPIKMVGDPEWDYHWSNAKKSWANREKAVYEYEIDRKSQDSRGFSHATYYQAILDNERINILMMAKWSDYIKAYEDKIDMDYEEAIRDNGAWDYHHDNYIVA